ncbi:MAG TPA: TIGR04255 family protein, partial [Acetobacteraceae bacterium]
MEQSVVRKTDRRSGEPTIVAARPSGLPCRKNVTKPLPENPLHTILHSRAGVLMMLGSLPPPLGGPSPAEIPLSHSPLVRVVAQTRFSSVLRIDSKDAMVAFQEEVGSEYPILEQTAAPQLQVEFSSGVPNVRQVMSNLWRFSAADRGWLLSLGTDAVTFETQRYDGRADFLARWSDVLRVVERIFAPRLALRLGVRYINRIHGESLVELTRWVRDSLIGFAQPELRNHITQALSEAAMNVEEGVLLLRWGILPPNATIDPGLLPAVADSSWILDLDVSS